MVNGLDIFKEHFKSYTDQYILIGGGACDVQFTKKAIGFRATKDLDIILIVEALTKDFVSHFWEFIKSGEYAIAEVDSKKCFYRFNKPKANGYPAMLELFSRSPDTLDGDYGYHITDIQAGEEASSLSAILLDDDYYKFVINNSEKDEDIHVASDYALICLKSKAYLNNKERKEAGQEVRSDDITKHRKDVLKLATALSPDAKVVIPDSLKKDLSAFIDEIENDKETAQTILNQFKMGKLNLEETLNVLKSVFDLTNNSVAIKDTENA